MSPDIVRDYRQAHEGEVGMRVLADTLYDLGFFDVSMSQEQMTTRNYAIRVIEKMGVLTAGDRFQLAVGFARLLQQFIPNIDEE